MEPPDRPQPALRRQAWGHDLAARRDVHGPRLERAHGDVRGADQGAAVSGGERAPRRRTRPAPRDADSIGGQYTWYWGFEIFSSEPNRRSTQDGSWPTDLNRGSCVGIAQDVAHVGIRLINLVLHDGTDAIGSFQTHQDGEIYGNLIYNNGWNGATDRGHGNGMYVQNQTGTKKISDNIILNQYGGGMQIYGSSAAYLDNIQVTGNTIYSSGWPSSYGCDRNFLFGGGRIATNGTMVSNYFYYPDSHGACTSGGSNIGYDAGVSGFTVQNNWFANGDGGISSYFFGSITGLSMTGNHFLQDISGVISPASYPSNTYHGTTKPTGTFAVRAAERVRARPREHHGLQLGQEGDGLGRRERGALPGAGVRGPERRRTSSERRFCRERTRAAPSRSR